MRTTQTATGVIIQDAQQVEEVSVLLLEAVKATAQVRADSGKPPHHMTVEGDILTVKASNGTWKYRLHPNPEGEVITKTVMATLIEADLTP